jgi:hypothetical protein
MQFIVTGRAIDGNRTCLPATATAAGPLHEIARFAPTGFIQSGAGTALRFQ